MMDEMIHNIPVDMLSEHQKASELIPEMSDEEWGELLESVEKNGVEVPIHAIRKTKEVLDGRHRLRAARTLGISKIPVIYHDYTETEAINFVCDTATKRRSLTTNQKIDIILNAKELIKKMQAESKQRQGLRTDLTSGPKEPKVKSFDTNQKIADMAGSSKTQVKRAKKVKRDAPDLYKEVVDGNRTFTGAEKELLDRKSKSEASKVSQPQPKGGDGGVKPQEETADEKEEFFVSQVLTFKNNVDRLVDFMGYSENIDEIIETACREDNDYYISVVGDLKKIVKAIENKNQIRRVK
jgi:ParB-like chromosome segregation protein Spo0J